VYSTIFEKKECRKGGIKKGRPVPLEGILLRRSIKIEGGFRGQIALKKIPTEIGVEGGINKHHPSGTQK